MSKRMSFDEAGELWGNGIQEVLDLLVKTNPPDTEEGRAQWAKTREGVINKHIESTGWTERELEEETIKRLSVSK